MSENKVIVLGLPFSCDDNALYDYFQECGEITESHVVMNRENQRSRGFGFVTFASEAAFINALEKNGAEFDGRTIKVQKAGERPKREQRERREYSKHEQTTPKEYNDTNKIIISSLAWSVNDDSLRDAFSKFGDVEECMVLKDRYSGRSRGRGILRFATEEAMKKAIEEMNGSELEGRVIVVRQFLPKVQREERKEEEEKKEEVNEEEEKEEEEEVEMKEEEKEEEKKEEEEEEEEKEEEMKEEEEVKEEEEEKKEEEEEKVKEKKPKKEKKEKKAKKEKKEKKSKKESK